VAFGDFSKMMNEKGMRQMMATAQVASILQSSASAYRPHKTNLLVPPPFEYACNNCPASQYIFRKCKSNFRFPTCTSNLQHKSKAEGATFLLRDLHVLSTLIASAANSKQLLITRVPTDITHFDLPTMQSVSSD
jgi:hypothetical protein